MSTGPEVCPYTHSPGGGATAGYHSNNTTPTNLAVDIAVVYASFEDNLKVTTVTNKQVAYTSIM